MIETTDCNRANKSRNGLGEEASLSLGLKMLVEIV